MDNRELIEKERKSGTVSGSTIITFSQTYTNPVIKGNMPVQNVTLVSCEVIGNGNYEIVIYD